MDPSSRRSFLKNAFGGASALSLGPLAARSADGVAPGMIRVPAGPFLMGTTEADAARFAQAAGYHPSWLAGETPQRSLDMPDFQIDQLPATNEDYSKFLQETGRVPPPHWGAPSPPSSIRNHPVVYVTLQSAHAFAQWSGKRLPTEAEWEKAARGANGMTYPWGNEFAPGACCWGRASPPPAPPAPSGLEDLDSNWLPGQALRARLTAPVNAHPSGSSPYGVLDMCGNAAEWCSGDPKAPVAAVKGGCWRTESPLNLRPASRAMNGNSRNASPFVGFRCAKDVA